MSFIDKNKLFLRQITQNSDIDTLFSMMDIDFLAFARIPLFMLRSAIRHSAATAVFLSDSNAIFGYCIHQQTPALDMMHILYIAVLPSFRSAGLGSHFLKLLGASAPRGILLDVEDPAAAKDARDLAMREKRIAFYQRNGFAIFPKFRFDNVGYRMRVMTNVPLSEDVDWLRFYHRLYNQAYRLPLAVFLIRPVRD